MRGPFQEVVQYQVNPWQGQSKPLEPPPISKNQFHIMALNRGVSDIKLLWTDTTPWS